MVWLIDLLLRHPILLTFSLLILIPFFTDYITTKLFYRTQRRKAANKKPPTIPYWIPGLFHGLGLLSRPSAYFALLLKKYGDYAPFIVKVGLTSYTVLRDPEHIKKAFGSSDGGAAVTPEDVEYYDMVLGAPKEVIDYYKSSKAKSEESEQLHHAHVMIPRKHLTSTALESLTATYISIFRRNMSNKMFQTGSWTQIEDLWSFFEIDITKAMTETLFGSALLKQYPKLGRDFWDFQSKVDEFLPGLPQFTVSSSKLPRDRLVEGLKKWLQATHGGTDFAKTGEMDPEWDETKGSKFIQECDGVFANLPAFGYHGRAVESLNILQRFNAIALPLAFWTIIEVLRNPALSKYLTSEISRHHTRKDGTCNYSIPAIAQLPNMQSLITEIRRLRLPTHLIHINSERTAIHLDSQWTVPNPSRVVAFAQDIGLNTPLWTKANPRTTSRPLSEFWPERFLIPDKSVATKRYRKDRDSITTGAFDLEGLETVLTAIGGSNFSEEQLGFARAIQIATLAMLVTEWEVELCDGEAVDECLPVPGEVAFAGGKPLVGIAVRIRRKV